MNIEERTFAGTLKDVKIKGEDIEKVCEIKLWLPFRQAHGEGYSLVDVAALSSWVGQNVQVTLRGADFEPSPQIPLPLTTPQPEEDVRPRWLKEGGKEGGM